MWATRLIFMLAELSLGFGFSLNVEASCVCSSRSSHGVFSSAWMGSRVVFGLGPVVSVVCVGLGPNCFGFSPIFR
jgi:hypothetical protein